MTNPSIISALVTEYFHGSMRFHLVSRVKKHLPNTIFPFNKLQRKSFFQCRFNFGSSGLFAHEQESTLNVTLMGKLYQCVIDRLTDLYSCWWCSELARLSEPLSVLLSVLPSVLPLTSGLRSAGLAAAGTSCRSSSPAAAWQWCSASPRGSAWSPWPGPQHRTGGTAASRGGCLCFERWVPLSETWGQKKKSSV